MANLVLNAIRSMLDNWDYVLWKREYQKFGIWFFVDLKRLSQRSGFPIVTIFDVGANEGQFASEALRQMQEATVYSFEPHPSTFLRLERRIRNPRCIAVQLAFGDCSGQATMFEYATDGGATLINSLVPNAHYPVIFGGESRQINVQCSTIDKFCSEKKIERIDLLKVDVEGFDLEVLRGARKMLENGRVRYVYAEFNEIHERPGIKGGALAPIAAYLGRFGFHYTASYIDTLEHGPDYFLVANALFCRAVPKI